MCTQTNQKQAFHELLAANVKIEMWMYLIHAKRMESEQ